MSDKDRQKKDHQRTDKKNKAMRESVSERGGRADAQRATGDDSNVAEAGRGTTDNARKRSGNR